jgi:hypothetical protein
VKFSQFSGSGLRGFFPGDGVELVAFAEQRLLDAILMRGEIEAEAALYAEEVLIDAGKVAVVGANDFVIADAECGLAAVRAVRANGRDVLHLPGARFVTIAAAGERADGANVDAHAAFFAIEMVAAIGNDDGIDAAHAHTEGLHVHAFIAYAHATETENAARSIVVDDVRPFFFGAMELFFDEAAGIGAVTKDHVLQFALAALIAHGAIERVIAEEKFQHVLSGVAHLLGVGAHDHAVGSDQGARCLQLRGFFHFDEAHAAGSLKREPRVITERRHFGADAACSFND